MYGVKIVSKVFQSTPPARGATCHTSLPCIIAYRFNPRPPQGERLVACKRQQSIEGVSIHAPRKGSDCLIVKYICTKKVSIHAPRKGSDANKESIDTLPCVSIHAPRKGSDS